jgi:hypothetical protein
MRWGLFVFLIIILAGCATPRLYDGEPVDKSNASLISNAYVKARIRPVGTDVSVEAAITDDGIWVSKGSYRVRYACLEPEQDPDSIQGYPHEKTIRVEAGYHYQVNCFDAKGQIKDEMNLVNIGWQDVWYHTSAEALYEVPEHVRGPGEIPATGGGFRYEFYNDWGGKNDVQFHIDTAYKDGHLTAELDLYSAPLPDLAMEAYDRGVRSYDGMTKAIAPTTYRADVDNCPSLTDFYSKLRNLFRERLNNPKPASPVIFTDSPPVYRYYMGDGSDALASLYIIEDKDELYRTTQEAMDYVKSCGTKQIKK